MSKSPSLNQQVRAARKNPGAVQAAQKFVTVMDDGEELTITRAQAETLEKEGVLYLQDGGPFYGVHSPFALSYVEARTTPAPIPTPAEQAAQLGKFNREHPLLASIINAKKAHGEKVRAGRAAAKAARENQTKG